MLLPFLILVGAVAVLAGGSRARPTPVVSGRQLTSGRPSACALLVEFARLGRQPPPALISSAIAEAQRAGHLELLHALVDTYVRPVVEAAEARRVQHTFYDPGYAYAPPAGSPTTDPSYPYPPPEPQMSAATQATLTAPTSKPPPTPWPAEPQMVPLGTDATDDEILRMIAHLSSPVTQAAPVAVPPIQVAPPGSFDPSAPLEGPSSSTGPGTLTVSGRSSPIDGVGNPEWARFCDRMSRELPTYTSVHHVGQFRQRRGRLLELGIDPEAVVASPDRQGVAFDQDMAEAYRRAYAAGLFACVGHPVEVPTQDGPTQVATVTGSGVLAVVQAAGVEGATSWFRSPEDRRRFPGTTAVFSRANGVF